MRETGADKGQVSRWLKGSSPGRDWQLRLAAYFSGDEHSPDPDLIFRHPDDHWMRRFFEGRSREEVERIKKSLEVTFPKTGTDG